MPALADTVFGQSIWGDEGFSAILSMKNPIEIIRIIINDTSPPLWNLAEWAAFQTFGVSETTIRLLSLIFYLITVFFVYKIGKLVWGKKTGVLAALLTALNPFFFTYAFEGRMYSIMAAGVAISMYYFIRFFEKPENNKINTIGYVAGTLWALYSHHFAIFAVILQGVWFLYEFVFGRRTAAKKIFKAMVIAGAGYLPWIYPLYLQTTKVSGGFWLGVPDQEDLKNLVYEYAAEGIKSTPYEFLGYKIETIALWLVGITLVFRKWHKKIKMSTLSFLWFTLPITAAWSISQVFTPVFYNRYLLYAIPGAMIILASNRRKISLTPIALVLMLFAVMDYHYFVNPSKLPFRDMAAYVKETRKEGDVLVNWDGGNHKLWEAKFYGISAPIYTPEGANLPFFVGTALMTEEDFLKKIPQDTKRVGVIHPGSIEDVALPGYTELETRDFEGLKFIWLTKTP